MRFARGTAGATVPTRFIAVLSQRSNSAVNNWSATTMWTGIIDAIHIAAAAKEPTRSIDQVRAIPGVDLEGDRYGLHKGTSPKPIPDCELTLIEAEAIEALQRDHGTQLAAGEARRNLVTRGVP